MTTTVTMRLHLHPAVEPSDQVDVALAACPGSAQHITTSRACRRRNRERGLHEVIPSCGDEADIDTWENYGIEWSAPSVDGARVHVSALLNEAQSVWLRSHLDLEDEDAILDTDNATWMIDGGSWRGADGSTPYSHVEVRISQG